MDGKTIINVALSVGEQVVKSNAFQKMLCGTYSNGEARSIPDALNGEIYSPEERAKKDKKKNKNKKGKKKNNKLKL